MSKILFVSEIYPSDIGFNSTHIMTKTLLSGLMETCHDIGFLGIFNHSVGKERMLRYCETLCPKAFAIESVLKGKCSSLKMLLDVKKCISYYAKAKHIECIPEEYLTSEVILISQSPTVESACICNYIKKHNPKAKVIQIWSDPVALSGITPERFSFKRRPFYMIEKKMLSYADKIIYVTKPLMSAQKKLYKRYADKMYYIDAPFKDEADMHDQSERKPENVFLYAGGFHSSIRNIKPLFDAVEEMKGEIELDVYGAGDVAPETGKYVHMKGVVPIDEMQSIELLYKNSITVLNFGCVQIPGKIFYSMNLPQNILVVCDGEYSEEIKKYLEEYRRFEMCQNNKQSIKSALLNMMNKAPETEYAKEHFSPAAIAEGLFGIINS